MSSHIPVLLSEVIENLQPEKGGAFLDATIGLGGHSSALLQKNPEVKLFGLDQDPEALALAIQAVPAATLVQGNFMDVADIAKTHSFPQFQGILMDIGVSSMQIDTPERGFSFSHDGPLDMRMDPENSVSAATIVNTWLEVKLANLIYTFGEERFSRRIAKEICGRRKKTRFETTKDLADFIVGLYPPQLRNKHPHPATRTFQALRIEVNKELEALEAGIEASYTLLAPGGRLAVITFHSLEDRIVKHMFRAAESEGVGTVLTKRPIIAIEEEQKQNPRSRSAKLRVFERSSPA